MQFRVLGPLEVDAGDGPIPLGGPKQRAVLANLVIRANQVVSADTLIHEVWGDEPPEKARNTLQTYVSNLRKTLGDGRLEGRPPGYVLAVEPSELDAARFDALVRDAKRALPVDPGVAVATLDDALAMWRGPALADLSDQQSLLADAARLDELRNEAQEDRIEGLLASRSQARAIGELEPLLARNPLRERLWGQLMLALYREGRQADALGAYQRARETLADELGIDPSPELVRLHERVLKQDPGLELRGEPLRGYRLLEKIGEGKNGAVFRAIQPHVDRDVAVKVFHERIAADPAFVRRFEPDARAAAALEHPHIAPVYDDWREPGRAYVVTRYLRGGSLQALEDRGEVLDRDRAARVVEQVASALAFAHRQGVVHGGVRPSNVLFDAEGNAYLSDFGIANARAVDAAADVAALALLARRLLDGPGSEAIDRAETDPRAVGADEISAAIRPADEGHAQGSAGERNPYKGLRAFAEADARDFFGRTALVERVVTRLNEAGPQSRFLTVVGPSGCGKSSLIRAGVVPAVRGGALAGAGEVSVAEMFPGSHPFDELESALVRIAIRPAARLHDRLEAGSRGLLEAIDLVVPGDAEVVLVVDQFEEVFTLVSDGRARERFLEALRVATADPASRLRVIATLRADFYDRPLTYPRFGELLAERTEAIPPLTPDELEQAIRRPAEGAGVRPEPGLVAEMIADVAHQPGALPLLQYALTELYERRVDDRLTLSAYRELGGVGGALSARADGIHHSADAPGRRAIRQMFLRLVTIGEGRQDTRRRVPRVELDALEVDHHALEAGLDSFGRHRLLTFDREPATREPTVEIAHESLLTSWHRLRAWIDDAREDLRQNQRLTRAAAEWNGSGRDPSFLMRGSRLEQVAAWAEDVDLALGKPERAYVKAGVDERDRERRADEDRRVHETRIERRSVRRLRGLVAAFAVAALVAGSLTVIATNQSGRAGREATRAERQALISRARELAAGAMANLEIDPERSILLAIEAVRTARSVDATVLPEAAEALHRSVVSSHIELSVPDAGGSVAWSPTGVFVATGVDPFALGGPHTDGLIDVRDADTGEIVSSFPGHDGDVNDVGFSPDGAAMATAGSDGTVKVWDPSTGALRTSASWRGEAYSVSFSPDGSFLAAATGFDGVPDAMLRILDLASERVRTFRLPPWVNDLAISPDGTQVAAAGGEIPGSVYLIDIATFDVATLRGGREVQAFTSVSWSPDGRYVAAGGFAPLAKVWDLATGRDFTLDGHTDFAHWVDWGTDPTRLVTGGNDGTARVWEIEPDGARELFSLSGSDGPVSGVTFSPDGTRVMASIGTEAVEVWDVGPGGDAEFANFSGVFGDVVFDREGRLLSSERDGSQAHLDIGSGTSRPIGSIDLGGKGVVSVDISPDGRLVAHRYEDGTMTVRDVVAGDALFSIEGPVSGPSWSPDGGHLAARSDGFVTIFDLDGDVTSVLRQEGVTIQRVWYGPAGLIATIGRQANGDVRLEIWEEGRGEVVVRIRARSGAFTTDSPLLFDYGDELSDVAFDPQGAGIATRRGATIEIWNVSSGELVEALPALPADIGSVLFSPDGASLAVGTVDGVVRLFDTATFEQVLIVPGHRAPIERMAFSADGSMLASQDSGGLVRVWALDIDDLLEIARQNVTRTLTDEECRQYLHVETCPT